MVALLLPLAFAAHLVAVPSPRAPRAMRPMDDNTVEQLDLLAWRPPARDRDPQAQLLERMSGAAPKERQRLHQQLIAAGRWEQRIHAVARRWRQPSLTLAELVQAGHIGLLEAARRYKPGSEGWATYATLWVRKEIERLCRRQGNIVMETEYERRRRKQEGAARRPAAWSSLQGIG